MSILWFIVIGIIAGWIAGLLVRGRGYGLVGDLIIGVVGAVIGGYLLTFFNITAGGTGGQLIVSIIGAVVLLFIARLFNRGSSQAV